MKRDVILAGSLIFVKEGTSSSITTALAGIGEIIEDYCEQEVDTCIISQNDIHILRFDFGRNRFLEFETIERDSYITDTNEYYCILRLSNFSNYDKRSLVMKVMFDVFNWD